jgi:cytochrome P450
MVLSGHGHQRMLAMHQKYGPIVRVGPYHLSVNHPDGMKEVRGHRRSGENAKDTVTMSVNHDNIIGANRADHQLFRRALSHGFSAQAMLEQQPIIRKYVNTLFRRLRDECADGGKTLDIEKWLNYTTFDIVGDLAFGEPFGCLENDSYHPWVAIVFQSIKSMFFLANVRRLPWLAPLLSMFIPGDLIRKLKQHKQLSREKVQKRLSLGYSRPDFMESMLKKSETAGRVGGLQLLRR